MFEFFFAIHIYTKKRHIASKQEKASTIRVNLLKPNGKGIV